MADERELVTVFRSADANGETEAHDIHDLLTEAGLHSRILDDSHPGVVHGSWEVRVPAGEAERAEQVLAADAATGQDEESASTADPSHQLDTESVYQSLGTNAEMEAMAIQGLLQSNGIDALIVGDTILPQLGFDVRVARERLAEALALIKQAETEGPDAALQQAGETAPEP